MIYAENEKKWWHLPLACLLGFHDTVPHPGIPDWEVCVRCNGERERK